MFFLLIEISALVKKLIEIITPFTASLLFNDRTNAGISALVHSIPKDGIFVLNGPCRLGNSFNNCFGTGQKSIWTFLVSDFVMCRIIAI